MAGEQSTVKIDGEGSCSYHRGSPPELIVGGGVAQPLMIPGTYGHGTAVPTPAKLADTNPVAGIAIRIPLSRTKDRCRTFHALQDAKAKLQLAGELLKADQISQDEYDAIARKVHRAMLK